MDFAKIQYFENIEKPTHREFINAHNNCILCNSSLELRHIRVPNEESIKEEAYCPKCEMRTRTKVFPFQ